MKHSNLHFQLKQDDVLCELVQYLFIKRIHVKPMEVNNLVTTMVVNNLVTSMVGVIDKIIENNVLKLGNWRKLHENCYKYVEIR